MVPSIHLFRKVLHAVGIGSVLTCCQQADSPNATADRPAPPQTVSAAPAGSTPSNNHNPDAGKPVTDEAGINILADWTRRYRVSFPNAYSHPRAFYINEKLVADILKQVNSSGNKGGLRMYLGLDSLGVTHMIVVAVDRNGVEVVRPRGATEGLVAPIVGETDARCPNNCDTSSPLTR
ncbi:MULTISPECIES: hypothetical protein [Hymenobacter]|uniref:Uncharacterized protein n=1 Tax=Hymenobacter mucosus TaxID=1411120 RepID=A0A238V931_9BACT|nr:MULTISPECIES: hypothetical protein [Hymenobacter]SNR30133.1 hypothetical protein SAMN06269173_101235 [Hymenobacter mucosus]